MAPSLTKHAVVAIDFGTARTGYAFCYTSDPTKVYLNQKWPGTQSDGKTLTEILLKKSDNSVFAFGYDARDVYSSSDKAAQDEWLYFTNFKMNLHNKTGVTKATVKATNCDCTISAVQLISKCIGVVKERAVLELATSQTAPITADNILWVVTVPAIWDIAARHAMEQAAILAGIKPDNILISLEPEAAAIWCLENQLEVVSFKEHPFMVIDAGGGTVDVTIHKLNKNNTLSEILPPSGADWGSVNINKEFETFLSSLFGDKHLLSSNAQCFCDLMDCFDVIKQKYQDSPKEPPFKNINISGLGGSPVLANIAAYDTVDRKFQLMATGTLRIPSSAMMHFFKPTLDKITAHVKNLLANKECQSVHYVMLVGGYSESSVLVKAIKQCIGSRAILITPPRPGTSVVMGAVRYGINTEVISSRIAIRTIGLRNSVTWDPVVHKDKAMIYGDDQKKYCTVAFTKFITVGTNMDTGCIVTHSCVPILRDSNAIRLTVVASKKPNVQFTDDEGVEEIGELAMDLPDVGMPACIRGVDVTMNFTGALFTVEAKYRRTGHAVVSTFKFPLG